MIKTQSSAIPERKFTTFESWIEHVTKETQKRKKLRSFKVPFTLQIDGYAVVNAINKADAIQEVKSNVHIFVDPNIQHSENLIDFTLPNTESNIKIRKSVILI